MTDAHFTPSPVILTAPHVRLEPLRAEHGAELLDAAADPAIWRWMPCHQPRTEGDMSQWIIDALARPASIPFAIISLGHGRAVGSTRLLDIAPAHRSAEIGFTWLGTPWQRSVVNTGAKRLLLGHLFDDLGAIRVTLKTDLRNEPSQRAIERLGAVREGVLRKSMIMPDGYLRSSVYYGITDDDWPAIRARLDERLAR